MSAARVFTVKNRLAAVMARPGGKVLADMLRAAERRVEALRGDCVGALDRQIDKLRAIVEDGERNPAALDQIYATANEIFAVTATFGPPSASQAAFNLCDLADHFRESGAVVWAAIDVHVEGLRLLIDDRMDPDAAEAVLAGLRRVRTRYVADGGSTLNS